MTLSISSTHYRRPMYSRQSVAALAAQPEAADCVYLASIDPSERSHEVESVLLEYKGSFKDMRIVHAEASTPSCNANTKRALVLAAGEGADFNFHVEDDVVMGRDALKFMLLHAPSLGHMKDVFTLSGWRHPNGWLPNCGREMWKYEQRAIGTFGAFTVWGWGTWPDRLEEILAGWTDGGDHDGHMNAKSWDMVLLHEVRKGRVEVAPMISRAQNIGDELGTHRGAERLVFWIDDCDTGA